MVLLKQALIAAAACITSTAAVTINVGASGGNATGYGQTRYGFLHEDINNSGDGGIYAELIRNRAFQYSRKYPVSLDAYRPINGAKLSIQMLDEPLSDALPASMRVRGQAGEGAVGFQNEGYWGMDVKRQTYTGSFWVRGHYEGSFTASLRSNLTDAVFGSTKIKSKSVAGEWVEHKYELVPKKDAPNSNNTLAITFDPTGTNSGHLDFNLISLFPPTFKNRRNGLRIDLAEALLEFNPSVIRFPGGNMLEGNTNRSYWDWKDSIGPLRYRPGFAGVWDYQQTHGLGLVEYLEWAEDFNCEFVVAVYAGLSLNGDITPRSDLQPFIDDALNEIEFIRGPADSPWGARRAELGHPEPFKLEYVEVGNEDWLAGGLKGWDTYRKYRFPLFQKAIQAAYPDIEVLYSGATTDGFPQTHSFPQDAIGDYHPYREPDWLVREFNRFDNETLRHIVGEVAAVHVNGGIRWEGDLYDFPWWIGTVGEAISMIGYERNADRVLGTFFAPVLRNMNRWQWSITLIQFAADPALTTRSTSWYIWSMFAHHPITETLPVSSGAGFGPVYYGAGRDETRGGAMVWKGAVYNTTNNADVPIKVAFEGVEAGTKAQLSMATQPEGDPWAYNDPFAGVNVVDVSRRVVTANGEGVFEFAMPELSVAVLDTDVGDGGGKRRRGLPGKPPGFRPVQ
ncbi:hypothetical protein LTR37_009368 [Vermiconidia calcicola]|uniref:Uncharacterized protein n=1 Tax=Vermiconidia calcicola TaxID=1690605 RepID=A0ACC3N7Z4_9PEZI|nr:hypothetical protein LTR37_009368 [Vermiconidia calcicola]